MEAQRWQTCIENNKNVMTEKAFNFLLMELETETLSPDVYRYCTDWGITVVYYMFDLQLLEKGIREPIYLCQEEFLLLEEKEDIIFQKILLNTVFGFRSRIILFTEYLKELEMECEEKYIPLITTIANSMELCLQISLACSIETVAL